VPGGFNADIAIQMMLELCQPHTMYLGQKIEQGMEGIVRRRMGRTGVELKPVTG
jgi:hypothetical protein